MLDASKGLAPGDPARMAKRIIESVDKEPAPLRMVLGSQALSATISRLKERISKNVTPRKRMTVHYFSYLPFPSPPSL